MSVTWHPCCPRCLRQLREVPDDADPSILGHCPDHGDVVAGTEYIGEPVPEQPEAPVIEG